jgi:hypothetical protein
MFPRPQSTSCTTVQPRLVTGAALVPWPSRLRRPRASVRRAEGETPRARGRSQIPTPMPRPRRTVLRCRQAATATTTPVSNHAPSASSHQTRFSHPLLRPRKRSRANSPGLPSTTSVATPSYRREPGPAVARSPMLVIRPHQRAAELQGACNSSRSRSARKAYLERVGSTRIGVAPAACGSAVVVDHARVGSSRPLPKDPAPAPLRRRRRRARRDHGGGPRTLRRRPNCQDVSSRPVPHARRWEWVGTGSGQIRGRSS